MGHRKGRYTYEATGDIDYPWVVIYVDMNGNEIKHCEYITRQLAREAVKELNINKRN